MGDALDLVLRDRPLVTLALALAIGWSLIQVAQGVAQVVTGLLYELPDDGDSPFAFFAYSQYGGVLAWDVGGRVLTLGQLIAGLIQLAVALGVTVLVRGRSRRAPAETPEAA